MCPPQPRKKKNIKATPGKKKKAKEATCPPKKGKKKIKHYHFCLLRECLVTVFK